METYLFKLGHQPVLSIAEIEAVLKKLVILYTSVQKGAFFLIQTQDHVDPVALNARLGGTVYIAKRFSKGESQQSAICSYLDHIIPEGKIQFSIHGKYKQLALGVKKALKKQGRSVRYVEDKNTATVVYNSLHKKKTHITIVDDELFATYAVQDLNEFSKRDFDKPGSDSKSGMLPPKLARIMVNIATGYHKKSIDTCRLLDPFCGSGAILLEGLDLGVHALYGSDISEKAVQDTKKNIKWLANKSNVQVDCDIKQIDAREMSKEYHAGDVDIIATEPYMGKPLRGGESESMLKDQVRELEILYTKAINEGNKVLGKGGIMLFIVPTFHYKSQHISPKLGKISDQLSYIKEPGSLSYHRSGQHLTRVFHFFKKN